MFRKKKTILFITRDKITANVVNVNKKVLVGAIYESKWDSSNLASVIKEIKKKIKLKESRILVSDDLCYQLEINLNKDITNEKDFIADEIQKRIPEQLGKEDWDYKVVTKENDKKVAVVIALVNSFWGTLNKAIGLNKVKVDAIESETSAKQRHEDPIVGLALKEDMLDPDREALNLTPKEMLDEDIKDGNILEKRELKRFIISITFGLFLGLVALAAAYYILVMNGLSLY